jgi:hypothetical protein
MKQSAGVSVNWKPAKGCAFGLSPCCALRPPVTSSVQVRKKFFQGSGVIRVIGFIGMESGIL